MDTIFALSTAPGKAGVAVIRISGESALEALGRLTNDIPAPRIAALRLLKSSEGIRLDEALILVFPEGQSFTGEMSVEIQCHGSPAIVQAILQELSKMPGLRTAEPGEFTRRALENDRLDLARVEGLADLLEAETEAQRRQALRVFAGDLGKQAEAWRQNLIRAAALIEATIDFADEDVPVDVSPEVTALLKKTVGSLSKQADGVDAAERIRTGFEVAIVGAPNVGKSTLLNALAGREAAITSEIAGTTRDVIEVRMDIAGLPVTMLDTAGLRDADDEVERIGVERARERAAEADLRVFLLEKGGEPEMPREAGDICLCAKSDLTGETENAISGKTGQGLDELIKRIAERLKEKSSGAGIATRLRHKQAIENAIVTLRSAQDLVKDGEASADLAAEEIRSAVRALDSLVGRVDVENVLDEIFASFCLGK